MIGRVNTGGGGSGGTLTVTAPAGVTVTVSKDGKTKTKVADSSGAAVFKGLASGEWTLTITDGSQTSTKPVVITADYSVPIAFFSATINVTYPAGSTCTATDGTTTLSAPDTSGTWVCVVPNAGAWTVSCTDNSYSASNNVTISKDGQTASVTLQYRTYIFQNGIGAVVSMDTNGLSNGSASIGTKTIVTSYTGSGSSGDISVHTVNKINLTKYNTLYFDMSVDKMHSSTGDYRRTIGVYSNNTSYQATNGKVAVIQFSKTAGRKLYSIDVSSINTSYYIGTRGIGSTTIYNIWLE